MEETITKRLLIFFAALLLGLMALLGAGAEDEGHTPEHTVHEQMQGEPAYLSTGSGEGHIVRTVYDLYCEDCREIVAVGVRTEETEAAHQWLTEQTDPTCEADGLILKTCALCGYETKETLPATGHQWIALSYTEPTCTENGVAIRQCQVCGQEERLETPALAHCYVWTEITPPSDQRDGLSALQCVLCGDVAETRIIRAADMLYNNTITSYGPTTRELIGGNVWNRVTPIDLSIDGVFNYPLIASNLYTVGTVIVLIDGGVPTVFYQLNSDEIQVLSESLVIYPDLNALRTGENAMSFAFGQPIDTSAFGDDSLVILGVTLKADYNTQDDGIQYFSPDDSQIATMTGLID